jgi:hypothetical protein
VVDGQVEHDGVIPNYYKFDPNGSLEFLAVKDKSLYRIKLTPAD